MAGGKYYVVWVGHHPGIYESWDECRLETEGYPGARYKAFSNRYEAIMAYREKDEEASGVLRSIARHLDEEPAVAEVQAPQTSPTTRRVTTEERVIGGGGAAYPPEVLLDSIAVDAGCMGNPGIMEYRGVYVRTGQEIFKVGPYQDGTNNIGEFLAIVHGLALLKQKGSDMPIYSDSMVAQKWVREKRCKTTIKDTGRNTELIGLIKRAETWLATNTYRNPILKWRTEVWGEIPADFGRK